MNISNWDAKSMSPGLYIIYNYLRSLNSSLPRAMFGKLPKMVYQIHTHWWLYSTTWGSQPDL